MIRVFDDVLADPEAYRAKAVVQTFSDVTIGEDTFRGIASPSDASLITAFMARVPGVEPTLTFFRKSPEGQEEPTFIHSDSDMGNWTGIYYMTPKPPEADGTTFWTVHGKTGGEWSSELAALARTGVGFEPWKRVEAKFNRLVVFAADLFHSRSLFRNYGEGSDARLVQVVFAR